MANADIILTPGEKGLYGRAFRPSLVLFWLRTNILVTNRRLAIKGANTILGVIPLGYEEKSMPIGSIAGITSSVAVHPLRLIGCLFLALMCMVGVFNTADHSVGMAICFFVWFLIFLVLAAGGVVAKLTITNSGGGVSEQSVSYLEMAGLEQFKNRANEFIYSSGSAGQSWEQSYEQGNTGDPDRQWNSQTQGTLPPSSGPRGSHPIDAPMPYGTPGRGYDDGGHDRRGHDRGYDDRGYDRRGYDDRGYDRGFDDRGLDDRVYGRPAGDTRDRGRHPYGQQDHDAPSRGRVATTPEYGGGDALVGTVADGNTPEEGYRIPQNDDRRPEDHRDHRSGGTTGPGNEDGPRDDFR